MKYTKIGVDLGNYSIKFVVLDETLEGHELRKFKEYIIRRQVGSEEYFKEFGRGIREFMGKYKIGLASLYITIPYMGNVVQLNSLTMPKMNKRMIGKGIPYEIQEKGIIDNMRGAYHRWKISGELEEVDEYKIDVAIIKKEIIKQLSKFNGVRRKIGGIEIQSISIGRHLELNNKAAVIDFGYRGTRLYFYDDQNKINHVDFIDVGGEDIEQVIEEGIKEDLGRVTLEDMLKEVYIYDESMEYDEDTRVCSLSKAITDKVIEIFHEVKRCIRGYELSYNESLESVICTGGLLNIKYFRERLASELDMEIKQLEFFTMDMGEDGIEDISKFNIAGMGVSDRRYLDYKELNFKKFLRYSIDIQPIAISILSLVVFVNLGVSNTYKRYDTNISELSSIKNTQVKSMEDLEKEIRGLKNRRSKVDNTLKFIDSIENQKKWLSDILYILSKNVPNKLVMHKIEITEDNVVLEGYSSNYSDIGYLVSRLEGYGNAKIESIKNEVSEDIYIEENSESSGEEENELNKLNKEFKIVLSHRGNLIFHGESRLIEEYGGVGE